MLSERERRTLAEIERHLREDVSLQRALDGGMRRSRPSRWPAALLVASILLMIAMVGLRAYTAAATCALLATGVAVALWLGRPSATRVE